MVPQTRPRREQCRVTDDRERVRYADAVKGRLQALIRATHAWRYDPGGLTPDQGAMLADAWPERWPDHPPDRRAYAAWLDGEMARKIDVTTNARHAAFKALGAAAAADVDLATTFRTVTAGDLTPGAS